MMDSNIYGVYRWFNHVEVCLQVSIGIFLISVAYGATNPADVAAINSLYVALESPPIPGWQASGGDPCSGPWQGITCNDTNIISITLVTANLGGELGNDLGSFSSLVNIDFSNNHIGGSIPTNLPLTLQNLVLPNNQLTGNLPDSLSSLTQLSSMSLDQNLLSGELPDAFQGLAALVNLDLSQNNLSGKLPSSMEKLSSLTTLRLQNNQLSGTLDVLQDLPLNDLNVENNLFNGPIPDKILNIPIFKKDGNPFNTTVTSSPPSGSPTTLPPSPLITGSPPSNLTPGGRPSSKSPPEKKPASGPEQASPKSTKKFSKTKKVVLVSVLSVFFFIVLLLALLLFIPRCHRRRRASDRIAKRHEVAPYVGSRDNPVDSGALVPLADNGIEREEPKVAVTKPNEENETEIRKTGWTSKPRNEREQNVQKLSALPKQDDQKINFSRFDIDSLMPPPSPPPPPPPPPPPHFEKVVVNPIVYSTETAEEPSTRTPIPPISVKSFTIAVLQQYTNSFSQENLIGAGMLGTVYRAELPNGKLLAVKKLDKRASSQQKEEEFLELVNNIDKIRHANVVELMGYCSEHGQRLLIYEYCSNGTLQDALHSDDDFRKQLSWNSRIRMALGAARALEYLHEICEPPIIHRNFKSANVLLDDELAVHISDCGLASLITSGSVSQLSGHLLTAYGYGAPEFESGIYTSKSDVFSCGVVMLEILTGRKSYDRSRIRGEHFLVRWAIPQLHDIDALTSMVDPSLNGKYPIKALSRFADVISRCVQAEPEFRPPMSEVVQDLLQIIKKESP